MFEVGIVTETVGQWEDGSLVEGAANVQRLIDRGAMVLPYDDERRGERLGGYCRIGWGEGIRLTERAARICPMLIRVTRDRPWIYWTASLASDRRGSHVSLQLLSNPGDTGTGINLEAGGDIVGVDGFTGPSVVLRGRRRVQVVEPGWLALDLYASGEGMRVLVTAATQSRIDVQYQ